MINKFGRKYSLEVLPPLVFRDKGDGTGTGKLVPLSSTGTTIRIDSGFTLEFSIVRRARASANIGSFRIYNLNEDTRNKLYKDFAVHTTFRPIVLKAGYEDPLPIVFRGNIKWAYSYRREGDVNFITEIEAYDNAYAMQTAFSNWTVPTETSGGNFKVTKDFVVKRLISDLSNYGVVPGVVSTKGMDRISQKRTVSDYTWKLLKEEVDGACFIDMGNIHVLYDEDFFEGTMNEISDESGLLGVPRKSQTHVIADMIFEPRLKIAQAVNLVTKYQKIYNQKYKIIGITHQGTISDSVDGDAKTQLTLYSASVQKGLVTLSQTGAV